jgi:hypothetical protein
MVRRSGSAVTGAVFALPDIAPCPRLGVGLTAGLVGRRRTTSAPCCPPARCACRQTPGPPARHHRRRRAVELRRGVRRPGRRLDQRRILLTETFSEVGAPSSVSPGGCPPVPSGSHPRSVRTNSNFLERTVTGSGSPPDSLRRWKRTPAQEHIPPASQRSPSASARVPMSWRMRVSRSSAIRRPGSGRSGGVAKPKY